MRYRVTAYIEVNKWVDDPKEILGKLTPGVLYTSGDMSIQYEVKLDVIDAEGQETTES